MPLLLDGVLDRLRRLEAGGGLPFPFPVLAEFAARLASPPDPQLPATYPLRGLEGCTGSFDEQMVNAVQFRVWALLPHKRPFDDRESVCCVARLFAGLFREAFAEAAASPRRLVVADGANGASLEWLTTWPLPGVAHSYTWDRLWVLGPEAFVVPLVACATEQRTEVVSVAVPSGVDLVPLLRGLDGVDAGPARFAEIAAGVAGCGP